MNVQVLGPGSSIPSWAESIEALEFGAPWGPLDDFEIMWLLEGRAFARWRAVPALGEAELLRIAVSKEHRRAGLGTWVLTESAKHLLANGCTAMHLEVRLSNAPAQRLYESLGWRPTGSRKAYYSDGEDAVTYRFS